MILKYNISYEVASTIFLIALLFYIKLQYDTHTRLNIEFRKLTWVGLFATVMDVTTAITISYPDVIPIKLNILLNTVYFILVAVLGYQLMFYDMYYVYRDGLNRKFIRFQKILIGCYVGLLITNIFAGFLFSFTEDGTYVKGPAHLTVYLAPFYFIFCSAVILICNLRKFRVEYFHLSLYISPDCRNGTSDVLFPGYPSGALHECTGSDDDAFYDGNS